MADSARILELRRRVHQDPASLAFAPLAEEYRRAGRLDDAVKTCRAGLAMHPGYVSARATLGRALLDRGEIDEALSELSTVLHAAPEHLGALKGVADILYRRGDLDAALDKYRLALALVRQDPELSDRIAEIELAASAATPVLNRGAVQDTAAVVDAAPSDLTISDAAGREAGAAMLVRLEQFLARILDDRARRPGV